VSECNHNWHHLETVSGQSLITANTETAIQFCRKCYELRTVKWVFSVFGDFCSEVRS
jgi:hypothetical protein